jgi:metal-sulfur cluster biosynthetic enzyme
VTEADILDALHAVEDPEAGMSVVDLGLVYDVKVEQNRVKVEMTMTSPACPLGDYLTDSVAAAVRNLAPDAEVEVALVWDPPWTPGRMSPEAQKRFGWAP